MTGKDYQHNLIQLIVSAHAYYLASGAIPADEVVCRTMASKALQAAAYALALQQHHNEARLEDKAAETAYRTITMRWRASVRRAMAGVQDEEAAAFDLMLAQQGAGEDFRTEARA